MGRFSRGWALAGQSWRVLTNDRSLVVFPVLSATFSTIAAALIFLPAAVVEGMFSGGAEANQNSPVIAAAIVAVLYVSTFIAIYFNVALAACAVRSLQGEDTSVSYGMTAATRRLGPILGWSLIAATIGLALRVLRERLPIAGQIAVVFISVTGAMALASVGLQVLGFALVAVGAVAVLVVTAVSTALSQIFRVAVYQFAVTEQTPRGFDGEMLQAAFSRR
jgi:membrane protein YdbS with pleckstrin-like domain